MSARAAIPRRIVILGVGNLLLSDEGLGVHALAALERDYDFPPEVELVDGGTCGMELLEPLTGVDLLILLDVIRANRAPGELIALRGDAVPTRLRQKLSPHQVGLADVLATLQLLDDTPREVVALGIEPASLALGIQLTPTVTASLPALLGATLAELARAGLHATPATDMIRPQSAHTCVFVGT